MIPCWPWLDLTRTLRRSFLRPCFVECPWWSAPSEVFQMSPPEPPERASVGPQVLNVVGLPACSRQLRLPTLSRPMLIGVIPRQAVYRLPTALSLILLTRSWDSSEARSEPWDRSITDEAPSAPVTRTICPLQHLADTYQAKECHLLTRGPCCSHFPISWLYLHSTVLSRACRARTHPFVMA